MIISTFQTTEEASKTVKQMLDERLIACANIIPGVKSLFWWKDKIIEEQEVIVFIKTRKELEKKVMQKLESIHPYDVPAIYAIDSTKEINSSYLQWILDETQEKF